MRFWIVNTFAHQFFMGSSATVIIGENHENAERIASEIKTHVTTQLIPNSNGHFEIRWFSPSTELRICGHGTLAASHVLWNELGHEHLKPLFFDSRSGVLKTEFSEQGITIDFPAYFTERAPLPETLITALGVLPVYVGIAEDIYLIELHSADDIMKITPDMSALSLLNCRGVILTSDGFEPYDFVSRFFEPNIGIEENAASAYAYTLLAPYWAKRLKKNNFFAHHLSDRGGTARILYEDERVYVTGQCITTCEGSFRPF